MFMDWWINNVAQPNNEILLNNKEEPTIDTSNNRDESQKHYAKGNNQA